MAGVARYLQVEWDVKKTEVEGPRTFDKDSIRGANPKCPQQTNYSDCGVYILQYVESFFEVSCWTRLGAIHNCRHLPIRTKSTGGGHGQRSKFFLLVACEM